MRHQKQKNSSFGRQRGPRKALIRSLVQSLVEKERIKTTLPKAKTIRPFVEKALTMGKRGDIHSRRLLFSRYPNKKTVDKILSVLSPRFKDRPGGYTRIIKLGFRSGDRAPLAYIEFVDYKTQAGALKESKTAEPVIKSFEEKTTKKEVKKEVKKETKKKETKQKENQSDDVKKASEKTSEKATQKTSKKLKEKSRKKSNQASESKKDKKRALAKMDKKRKKARKQEKKSRRLNR